MRAGRPSICRKPATTTLPSETTSSPAETEEAGRRVGERLRRGDVVLLTGALGAGKTTFVRGVAHGTGSESPVASPTFQLVRVYPGRLQLAHIDLYRVESNSELRDLGLEELAEQGAVVVEWGDRIEVDGAALIQIEHLGGDRRLIRTMRDLSH
ncbi:MAG: tRNA (adenosine(37)-N6)-threonylcarbamoyltransferase complex ATPase subunit type 1 TsaE [Chloroflexi bacterium]|nr:MAG: tRNA (adenosine(37)-N6)-threonylcarbamoyltransferase complex ATPase subunit type 1 TsaE [Chloroflexota bacterium]TMG68298.1 MAG: tRNA (adenosine(37)-N6)-threonylcarbamoyltransferase complex ATPase subunit type 1 TsaE [Chloroflexota bacterium]